MKELGHVLGPVLDDPAIVAASSHAGTAWHR